MGLETLVLAGIATDMCVETTARDAADRGFNVILAEDATATFFEHHHRSALSGFARVFGQVWESFGVLAFTRRDPAVSQRPSTHCQRSSSAAKTGPVTAISPRRRAVRRTPRLASISTIVASNGGSIRAPTVH